LSLSLLFQTASARQFFLFFSSLPLYEGLVLKCSFLSASSHITPPFFPLDDAEVWLASPLSLSSPFFFSFSAQSPPFKVCRFPPPSKRARRSQFFLCCERDTRLDDFFFFSFSLARSPAIVRAICAELFFFSALSNRRSAHTSLLLPSHSRRQLFLFFAFFSAKSRRRFFSCFIEGSRSVKSPYAEPSRM